MDLNRFISKRSNLKSTKYKTVYLDRELHLFLKRTANHYNIPIADLLHNIVDDWKSKYQDDIIHDISKTLL